MAAILNLTIGNISDIAQKLAETIVYIRIVVLLQSCISLYFKVSLMYMFSIDKILSALSHLFANDGPLKEGFEITNTTEIFGIVHRSVYAAKGIYFCRVN